MNQDLTYTYLQQLEIDVWERRPTPKQPEWTIIHEASEPLIGKTELLFHAMLASIGQKRDNVLITPINFNIKDSPKLQATPKALLILGEHAAQHLLNIEQPLSFLREKTHYYGEQRIPVIVSYHPTHLLSHAADKSSAFTDWLRVKALL